MKPEGSLQSRVLTSYLFKTHFNIILPIRPTSSKQSLSVSLPSQNPVRTSFRSHVFHTPPSFSFSSIWSSKMYLVRSRNHETSGNAILSSLLLRPPSYDKVSSSAPYSPIPSAYVLPSFANKIIVLYNLILLDQTVEQKTLDRTVSGFPRT
jgi:hypothetical protein